MNFCIKFPPNAKTILLSVSLFFISCQGSKYLNRIPQFTNRDTIVNISKNLQQEISMHYIGCSGFLIKNKNNYLLIDPYFSFKPWITGFSPLTNTSNIKPQLKHTINSFFNKNISTTKDSSGKIQGLLIAHGHIDHYGDVPYLYQSNLINKKYTKVICNNTTQHYLKGDKILTDTSNVLIKNVEQKAQNKEWIYINDSTRVLPIKSEHGPHFKILGCDLNLSPSDTEKIDRSYKSWRKYKAGNTISFLIDYLNPNGSINFRIYHCSAASNNHVGIPDSSILAQHPVDIQIVCVASFNKVKNYPKTSIEKINPKHIILTHWEKFLGTFTSIDKMKQKPHCNQVYSTRKFMRKFNSILDSVNAKKSSEEKCTFSLPNVNTKLTFRY